MISAESGQIHLSQLHEMQMSLCRFVWLLMKAKGKSRVLLRCQDSLQSAITDNHDQAQNMRLKK